jgi:hypothetical protein
MRAHGHALGVTIRSFVAGAHVGVAEPHDQVRMPLRGPTMWSTRP